MKQKTRKNRLIDMKLKKIVFAIALTGTTLTSVAQDFKDATLDERIAFSNNGNEDSVKIGRGHASRLEQSMKKQD